MRLLPRCVPGTNRREDSVIIKGADMDRAGQPWPEADHVASGMRKQINPACFVCEHVNEQAGS